MTMKTIPEGMRPYERLEIYGAKSLNDAELLAILIKSGTKEFTALETAQQLLQKYGSLADLGRAELNELRQQKGIGRVKSIEILASIEIGKRILLSKRRKNFTINDIKEFETRLILELGALKKENLIVMLFDKKWQYISSLKISEGTSDFIPVKPQEILCYAIKNMASSIIIAHNHPSGECTPGWHDMDVTEKLIKAARFVGIDVADHIVVGDGECYSMRAHGEIERLKNKTLCEGDNYGT